MIANWNHYVHTQNRTTKCQFIKLSLKRFIIESCFSDKICSNAITSQYTNEQNICSSIDHSAVFKYIENGDNILIWMQSSGFGASLLYIWCAKMKMPLSLDGRFMSSSLLILQTFNEFNSSFIGCKITERLYSFSLFFFLEKKTAIQFAFKVGMAVRTFSQNFIL